MGDHVDTQEIAMDLILSPGVLWILNIVVQKIVHLYMQFEF